eukprot:Seg8947.1 transcript_id=Seg8947.1/GoldUCD/mRNA.D3Y31 product="hypothetical protein" protein_id=Seg8947.1/GoldUCD/D3Y31
MGLTMQYVKENILANVKKAHYFSEGCAGTCVVRDKLYKVGTFTTDDCTAECECRSNGEYGCVALCPTGRITCRPGERKITVQVPARGSSRCTCPYLRCVSAGSLSSSRSNGLYNSISL